MSKRKRNRLLPAPRTWGEWRPLQAGELAAGQDRWDSGWHNEAYEVRLLRDALLLVQPRLGSVLLLSARRRDGQAVHDWRDLQRIKNELVGRENEAIELYPRESRLVDSGNTYFLWVLAEPGVEWPIGYCGSRVVTDKLGGHQRPFDADEIPVDNLSREDWSAVGEQLRDSESSRNGHNSPHAAASSEARPLFRFVVVVSLVVVLVAMLATLLCGVA